MRSRSDERSRSLQSHLLAREGCKWGVCRRFDCVSSVSPRETRSELGLLGTEKEEHMQPACRAREPVLALMLVLVQKKSCRLVVVVVVDSVLRCPLHDAHKTSVRCGPTVDCR